MPSIAQELLGTLLKEVSRSFYLTLRILPGRIRPQIGLAYLLARTTDTIADTRLVPVDQRLEFLDRFRKRVLGISERSLDFAILSVQQASPAERLLLKRAEEVLSLLSELVPADRTLVRQVIEVITSGQELDLRRFSGASRERVHALRTHEDLDDYTYRVAGCVGEFWTRMCRAHVFPHAALDDSWLIGQGACFGKGLQLVNILRDMPVDLRQGRCYLPGERVEAVRLTPQLLLDPCVEPRLRPLYDEYLSLARGHLRAGWSYTNALPHRCVRVRLACAWPLLIGADTLDLLARINVLDPDASRKVTRKQVKRAIWRSILSYPIPGAWAKLARS